MILLRFCQAYIYQRTKNTKTIKIKNDCMNQKKLNCFELPSLAFLVLLTFV